MDLNKALPSGVHQRRKIWRLRANELYFQTCSDRSYFHKETKVSHKGSFIWWPHHRILDVFGLFVRVDRRCCPQQSCSAMDLNKALPSGVHQRRKIWRFLIDDKVQQQDEDAKSSQTGCRSLSRTHDRADLQIDWCCFYYFLRNSLVALLEALFARIFLDLRYSFYGTVNDLRQLCCRILLPFGGAILLIERRVQGVLQITTGRSNMRMWFHESNMPWEKVAAFLKNPTGKSETPGNHYKHIELLND